jgi:hypothetical protein
VGLGQRPLVAGGFGQLERAACPLQRRVILPLAVGDQAEVGVKPGEFAG